MRAGTYPARGYATLELSGLELSFTGAYNRALFDKSNSTPMVNLPALDRSQLLYVPYSGLQEPVFLVNSRMINFCCESGVYSRPEHIENLRSAFLPSSLNHLFPYALVFSTLPTCVGLRYEQLITP